ncbi:VWA domain-containing protein [Saxibacter everestensis]|uniref:VWA domain-containing protein n=1 Tax=Saxibacter everestensis TaxID=2909229 RepID=A0ABY8QR01_9MICO|nr:VWA domain-containing protein [Brevibacteriaceae bacterium ZFBP1038]
MGLTFWWLAIALAVTGAAIVWCLLRRGNRRGQAVPVAHSERLTALPLYRHKLRRYQRVLAATISITLVAGLSALAVAARPTERSTHTPEQHNRDIILCLDVSGSMLASDAAVAEKFAQLARKFDGERIGLTLFDSSAVSVFPLTDDYDFVAEQLSTLAKAFTNQDGDVDFYSGTGLGGGSSLIGDGLASCVQSFDRPTENRARSVVFATDNYVSGSPIYTLPQAAELARKEKVRVYGINPNDFSAGSHQAKEGAEMRNCMERTDGEYYALDDAKAVGEIVATVQEREASLLSSAPTLLIADRPTPSIILTLLGLIAFLVLVWRLKL